MSFGMTGYQEPEVQTCEEFAWSPHSPEYQPPTGRRGNGTWKLPKNGVLEIMFVFGKSVSELCFGHDLHNTAEQESHHIISHQESYQLTVQEPHYQQEPHSSPDLRAEVDGLH